MLAHKPRTAAETLRNFAFRGLMTQAMCLAIALLLSHFGTRPLLHNLAYSHAIGTSCWLLIDGSIHFVARFINQGRILAEGNVHQIRDLIDEHPHTVYIKADEPRSLARAFLSADDVLSLKFEEKAVIVQTGRPDVFYARLTALAASGEHGSIHEVTSPDDNLQAVFQYLVKS